jgi:hypothetical protein
MTEMMTTVIGLLIAIIGLVTLVIRGQAKAQRPNGGKSRNMTYCCSSKVASTGWNATRTNTCATTLKE